MSSFDEHIKVALASREQKASVNAAGEAILQEFFDLMREAGYPNRRVLPVQNSTETVAGWIVQLLVPGYTHLLDTMGNVHQIYVNGAGMQCVSGGVDRSFIEYFNWEATTNEELLAGRLRSSLAPVLIDAGVTSVPGA